MIKLFKYLYRYLWITKNTLLMMTTLFTLIAVFLGCNISRTSLMKNDKIMVEKIDSNCFMVQKGNISKEDGSIIVFGKVERKRMSMAASGHVDIEVLNESVK